MGGDGLTRSLTHARLVARQPGPRILDMVECWRSVFGRIAHSSKLRDAVAKLVVGLASRLIW